MAVYLKTSISFFLFLHKDKITVTPWNLMSQTSRKFLMLVGYFKYCLFLLAKDFFKNSFISSVCASGVTEDVKIFVGLKPIKTILGRLRL